MRKIILVPIEPLDSRYTIQWLKWFSDRICEDERFDDLIIVDPEPLTVSIESGAFLDVIGTNYYKAAQIQQLCSLIYSGSISDRDTILLLDGWFPGIEALAYIRDGLKRKFKIAGCFHAGTYDSSDFISKMGMGVWGEELENSWFKIFDSVFVATEYHKQLIWKNRNADPKRIHVTGFPIMFDNDHPEKLVKKSNIVVFPHRLTSDKQPELFDQLAEQLGSEFPDWHFIKTQEKKRSKEEYYSLLWQCSIAVSFALHENWGIAMQEALFSGCIPVVPDRLSYREMYPEMFRYKTDDEAIEQTRRRMIALEELRLEDMHEDNPIKMSWNSTVTDLYGRGAEAIPNILEVLYEST